MSETVKLTDEEISSVKDLREQVIAVISSVGQTKLTVDLLKDEITELENKFVEQTAVYKSLLEQEKTLINGLLEKYGVGSLDIDTGVFTPEKK
jgi:hypothetical protein